MKNLLDYNLSTVFPIVFHSADGVVSRADTPSISISHCVP